jgi:hypothetical protein
VAFMFQGRSSVSWRCHNVQGDHTPAKRQKMLKKFKNSSKKTVTEQSLIS